MFQCYVAKLYHQPYGVEGRQCRSPINWQYGWLRISGHPKKARFLPNIDLHSDIRNPGEPADSVGARYE